MLGSVAEAEDVVQDLWLRWADRATIERAEGWLMTIDMRLSIDRLRSEKSRRESYVGTWLPELRLTWSPATPEQMLERADELSVALLILLESLSPAARVRPTC